MLNDSTLTIITLVACIGCASMAGLFFIFSNTVMPALSRITPSSAVAVMDTINRVIINPLFMLLFLGTPITCLLLAAVALMHTPLHGNAFLLAGSAIYLLGSFGVTAVFNVPLNNALASHERHRLNAAEAWQQFFRHWLMWNHVRTFASLLSAILFACAIAQRLSLTS